MSKYYPPEFEKKEFHCVHCNVYAKQVWFEISFYKDGYTPLKTHKLCICQHCYKRSIWNINNQIMVDPAMTTNILPHEDMPEAIKALYMEALSVIDLSPKASSALLRLALQKLMPLLGANTGKLDKDIAKLVAEGLPVEIQQALDYCRVIGNNAVHPNELNLDDTPEMAHAMFDMINFIVEEKIAKPKRVKELFSKLPTGAKEAIDKRDKKAT